jgi:hypothetical protein
MFHANVKLLGVLAIIFLTSSYVSLAAANPLSFATPTPTPTDTPTPTPKPEPKIYPTLEMYCRTTASASNLKVEVTGKLAYNKSAIPNAPVYIGYSADLGSGWENFTLVQTDADGTYEGVWTPNATGNYLLCAQWMGNDTLHWINATVNLALTHISAGNAFSVTSNSTISNLNFNSENRELSFITNGTSGTTGYAYVCLPKDLDVDIQTLQVNMDGQSVTFTSESTDDVWVISCVYTQSAHVFSIQLPVAMQVLSPAITPWVLIVIGIAVLIVVIVIVAVVRRRRKTAAMVAEILKQNRPVY